MRQFGLDLRRLRTRRGLAVRGPRFESLCAALHRLLPGNPAVRAFCEGLPGGGEGEGEPDLLFGVPELPGSPCEAGKKPVVVGVREDGTLIYGCQDPQGGPISGAAGFIGCPFTLGSQAWIVQDPFSLSQLAGMGAYLEKGQTMGFFLVGSQFIQLRTRGGGVVEMRGCVGTGDQQKRERELRVLRSLRPGGPAPVGLL